MTLSETRAYCLQKKGVTEDIKWGEHICYSVGGKLFLITSPDSVPCNASFKADEEEFESLVEQENFIPAPHLGRYKWVMAIDISVIRDKVWKLLLDTSYSLVLNKLSKQKRNSILND